MKNKTTLLFIGFTTFWFLANSQVLKTYSGNFERGKATYQYYENEKFDRVFHGSFSYTGSIFNMKGLFLNGKKNGAWEFFATNKLTSIAQYNLVVNTKVIGNYKNGELNGTWFYSNSNNTNSTSNERTISTANFYKNHFIGKVTYESNFPKKYSVEGQFDESGLKTGIWKYQKDEIKDEIKFLKGVAYWRLCLNITNGEKILFCDSTLFVKRFWNSYNSLTKISFLNGKLYCLDTIEISPDKRVSDNGIIGIIDPISSIDGTYNPICIWTGQSSMESYKYVIGNPLYYYNKGSIAPHGYEVIIKECEKEIGRENGATTKVKTPYKPVKNGYLAKPEIIISPNAMYRRPSKEGGSEGITGRPGDQGVVGGVAGNGNGPGIGTGTGAGISYDLGGRSARSLPKPSYNSAQQGRAVVTIWVNQEGKVTRVLSGAKGTTVTDPALIRQAETAARQALFSANPDGPEEQIGKIIYNFLKLN
jgi:hypothetical protein